MIASGENRDGRQSDNSTAETTKTIPPAVRPVRCRRKVARADDCNRTAPAKHAVDENATLHTTYPMAISADQVIETFGTATEENQISPLRQNQVVNAAGRR